jgi:hypothetical protein
MRIRAGYDIAFTMTQPTPMVLMLTVHPSRSKDLLAEHKLLTAPKIPLGDYRDMFGNVCTRVMASPGLVEVKTDFEIYDSGKPDEVVPRARQHPIAELPDDALVFLLGSRYCDTQSLSDFAGGHSGRRSQDGRAFRRSATLSITTSNSDIPTRGLIARLLMHTVSGLAYVVTLHISPSHFVAA